MSYLHASTGHENANAERRNYLRVPFSQDVSVVGPAPSKPVSARTLDISLGGVGVYCSMSFARELRVSVVFRLRGPGDAVVEESVPGRVVSLSADDRGNRIGIEFLEPLQPGRFPVLSRVVARL
jgi:c-di-GMP-binding flagellar brake protein YcgR